MAEWRLLLVSPAVGVWARCVYNERMRVCSALLACCLILIGCRPEDSDLLGADRSAMSAGTLLRAIPNPDPDPDDWFGGIALNGSFAVHSVYPSGSNFLVGTARDDVGGLTDAGSFRLYDGYTGNLVATLPNPLPQSNAGYGFYALTIGDYIFTSGSDPADPAGSGCLFQFTTSGEFLRKIPNPAPQAGDSFGWPLTAVGPHLVVGASYDSPNGVANGGSVYLIDGMTGDVIAEIPNPEPAAYDWEQAFIHSVGANFVVASRSDEPVGGPFSSVGRAYLFDGATGALIAPLSDPTPLSNEDFGWRGALDLGAGKFALATPHDFAENLVDRPGSVHLFDASTGTLDLTIANPGGMSNDGFGNHMATDGADRFLVAAPNTAVLGTNGAGALYLFRASSGALLATIPNPRPAANDSFGYSASFVDGRIVVPTQSTRSGGIENAGAVYVFDTSGTLVATIDNPAPAEGLYFGYPLAVSGTSLAIGHSYDDVDGVSDFGRISIYDLDGSLLSSMPNPGSMPEGLFYSQGLTAVAGNFVLGSITDTVAGVQSAGALYLIAGPNDLPVAADDAFTTDEDTALVVSAPGVLANDVDADADALTATLTQPPVSGTLAFATDGSFTYTPGTNFAGADVFHYVTHDGSGESSPGTVTLTVTPVDDPPVALDITRTGPEDPLFSIPIGMSFTDPDGCPDSCFAFAEIVTQPSYGTASSGGGLDYRPDLHFNGTDSFTYRVHHGQSSATATVTVIVTPVNDRPVAVSEEWTIEEDQPLSIPQPGVLANDSDVEDDTLFAVPACPPGGCTVSSGDPQDSFALSSDGSFLYTPPPEWAGVRTFLYQVNDSEGGQSEVVTVRFTITSVEDAPTAGNDVYVITEDTPFMVTGSAGVLANDSDPDSATLVLSLADDVSKGALSLGTDGSFAYIPDPNEYGDDTFTYSLSDGLSSSIATVTLTIVPTDDAAVAFADTFAATEDLPLVVSSTAGLLANDIDLDDDVLVAVLGQDVQDGTLVLGSDGSFVYTPDPEFSGSDAFTYHVNDGTANTGDVSVSIEVASVDDVPLVMPDDFSVEEDGTLSIDATEGVLANDTDVDSSQLTVTLSTAPARGALILDPDGALMYMPDTDYFGADSFEYVVTDGAGISEPGWVSLTVGPVNDAPSAPALLFPADGAVLAAAFAVEFQWLAAIDVESEPVTYQLDLLRGGTIAATFDLATLSHQVVALDGGDYTWRVAATDGMATTLSPERAFQIDSESDGEAGCACSLSSQTRSGFSAWMAAIPILASLFRRRRNRS